MLIRGPRRQRHEQPAVLVVGGEEVDGDRLANRRPRRELEREAELADAPLLHDADRLRIREREDVADVAPHQVALLEARQLEHAAPGREHPRVAVADDEAGRGGRVVVLEQLEDEAESAAPALQRVGAREPLEAVDVDRAVLAVRADVDGHGRIVGTCRRAAADKAHSVDDRAAHSLASEC